MTKAEYKERFEKLYQSYSEATLVFYTWKGLNRTKDHEKTFNQLPAFWKAVQFSLENTWLSSLSKIYEDSSYSKKGKVISVHALLPHHSDMTRSVKVRTILQGHRSLIESILRLRDHQLAHFNAKHLLNPNKLLAKFPIKYQDVDNLLVISGEILSLMNPYPGNGYIFSYLAETSEQEAKTVINHLEFFYDQRKEHLGKFTRGEIGDPRFPPK